MIDHTAFIGLRVADPSVPWPPRGSGGRELIERPPYWTRDTITAPSITAPRTIDIMRHTAGCLAVNVMMEGEGFAICIAATGYRLSCDGAVFARCEDAMQCVELMECHTQGWTLIERDGWYDQGLRDYFRNLIEYATRRGEILIDPVFPH